MNRRRPPRFPCSSAPYVPILIPHRPNTVKSTRNMLWLLAMLFCNWPFIRTGTSSTVSTRPDVVNIGALLSYNSSIGKVAKVALETAVEDVNSNPAVLNGTKLNLTMQDTKLSSGFLGIVEASRFMENETVAIIGPQHSVMAHVISHIANELQVPLLSFAATDPTLNSLQFPYFVRTTQSDGFQMAAVADIVGYYEWRDVIAIYIDDDHGRNGVSALGDKLAEKRCKISYKAPMSPKLSSVEITRTLVKVNSMDSRVFILHISATWGLEVLINAAREMNMMRREYVWIATDWLSTVLDTESSLTSAAMDSIQGVLTLRMHIPDSEPKKKLFSRWNNILSASNYTENSRFGLNTYGMYAYDTVWLLAHSLDEFLNQGGNISFSNDTSLTEFQGGRLQFDAMSIFDGGNKLRDIISRVNTTGVTGKLEFTSEGDLVHPAYEVINVIGTGIRTIGYWSNSSGLSVNFSDPDKHNANSKQQLYGVIWPGQTTQKPRGWAFSNNNGRQLRVGVPNRINYPEFVSQIENSDNSYGGFCIDVFNAAKEELPYAVQYKFVPYGDGHKNPVTSDLLHMITTGALDAVVGDITITTNRTKMVDFTQPFIESGLVVVAPVWKLNSSAWAFLRPFTPMMWCATGVYFLLVGAVLWILERRTNDEFRGPPRRQFVTIIWFSFSTLFFSHKERIASTLGRFVLIIWLFVVLILNSSYTASMTSILTVERLSSPVKGIESLVTSSEPIGFQRGSFSENYLTDELNIHKSRLVPLNSIAEYEKALRDGPSKGGVAAVVDERAYMELFLSTRCEFGIVGQEFTKMGWGFAFPRDSPLAIDMSTAILTLSENGVLQRLHDKWLTRSACSSEGTKQGVDRLQLQSFWGLFILCGSVCLLALLFYLIKMIREYTRHSRQISPQSGRLRSFLSFVKEKEDHHHEEAEGKSESKSSRPTRDQRVHSNGRVHGEIMMAS